ncbi:VanZ like family protein [Eubacterium uniforme]|uniref:VanZ like family protein n=1 Tax=Eubacterium uniforme TaxID=39495 RepID=A0A1T4W6I6_9FIRM|nr:VanZ family protein [Eubacterium uniforme]SKA72668.1 VanZ like family protein [Eubacterium uniforme]
MLEISFLAGEVIFSIVWVLSRAIVWGKNKKIDFKREVLLMLMYINLFVIIRFVFYELHKVDGKVVPLIFNKNKLWPLDVNLEPAIHLFDYETRREALINLYGNIGLFIPTGIILPILYKGVNRLWKAVAIGFGMSLTIEILQLLFYERTSDVDDLIMNTAGAAIGYLVCMLVKEIISVLSKSKKHMA